VSNLKPATGDKSLSRVSEKILSPVASFKLDYVLPDNGIFMPKHFGIMLVLLYVQSNPL
jgi:hypothetical protein